ncbi:MAG: VIT domain-containing protein [Wenzhouxiangellaceae bacterium]
MFPVRHPFLMLSLLCTALFTLASAAHARNDTGLKLLLAEGPTSAVTLESRIEIEVTGMLARSQVTQRFINRSGQWSEGRYLFPLPDGAVVDELSITIDDRVIEGLVLERNDARQVYTRARNKGQVAGLVERHRPNLFSTSIANIAPDARIEVRIGFSQTVEYRNRRFTLRFPTTLLPRHDNQPAAGLSKTRRPLPQPNGANPDAPWQLEVRLRPGVALAGLESPHHPVRIRRERELYRVELEPSTDSTGRDFELTWSASGSDQVQGALFVEDMHDQAHALLMLVPPMDFRPTRLARELIVLLDTSGSMRGDAFEQARHAVNLALQRTGPDDHFNVIAFSSSARPLFDAPMPATRSNLRQALAFVERLRAQGGTEIDAALQHALAGRVEEGRLRQVVLITDGMVSNEQQVLELVRTRAGHSRIFSVGIGHGVNGAFLQSVARAGRGSLTRINDPNTIGQRIDELLGHLEGPVLTDLRIEWPHGAETWPAPLPDLYAGEPLMALARLDVAIDGLAPDSVRATGFSDLSFVELEWPLQQFQVAPGVARAWAQARIDGLAVQPSDPAHDPSQLRARNDQRLLTALDYQIVSDLTSLVAVDRKVRRDGPELNSSRLAASPPSDRASVLAMPATDAGTLERLLRGLAILLVIGLLLFNRRIAQPGTARLPVRQPGPDGSEHRA